jgi:hypothetical protein
MRFCSVGLKTMPGTNPPASMRTLRQEYATVGAARALGTFIVTRATADAPAANAAASTPAIFLRMEESFLGKRVPRQSPVTDACA